MCRILNIRDITNIKSELLKASPYASVLQYTPYLKYDHNYTMRDREMLISTPYITNDDYFAWNFTFLLLVLEAEDE